MFLIGKCVTTLHIFTGYKWLRLFFAFARCCFKRCNHCNHYVTTKKKLVVTVKTRMNKGFAEGCNHVTTKNAFSRAYSVFEIQQSARFSPDCFLFVDDWAGGFGRLNKVGFCRLQKKAALLGGWCFFGGFSLGGILNLAGWFS